jgi:hypothetical protein
LPGNHRKPKDTQRDSEQQRRYSSGPALHFASAVIGSLHFFPVTMTLIVTAT